MAEHDLIREGVITKKETPWSGIDKPKNQRQNWLAESYLSEYFGAVDQKCRELGLPVPVDGLDDCPSSPLTPEQFTALLEREHIKGIIEALRWVQGKQDNTVNYRLRSIIEHGSAELAARNAIEFLGYCREQRFSNKGGDQSSPQKQLAENL